MIKSYTTKPKEVQAVQWTGDNFNEISEWLTYVGYITRLNKSKIEITDDFGEINYILPGEFIVLIDDSEIKICFEKEFYENFEPNFLQGRDILDKFLTDLKNNEKIVDYKLPTEPSYYDSEKVFEIKIIFKNCDDDDYDIYYEIIDFIYKKNMQDCIVTYTIDLNK